LGRFITPDWAANPSAVPFAEFTDPQSLNLYSYVRNIPTTKHDVDGHDGCDMSKGWCQVLNAIACWCEPRKDLTDKVDAFIEKHASVAAVVGLSPKVQPYDVGGAQDLRKNSAKGDGLDIHHAPQQQPARQTVQGYDGKTGPAIAIPQGEHKQIPTEKGDATLTPRDQLAKDVKDLRNNTNAPNIQIQRLIELNKQKFPEMNKAPRPAPVPEPSLPEVPLIEIPL
jgi:hypothetical protein